MGLIQYSINSSLEYFLLKLDQEQSLKEISLPHLTHLLVKSYACLKFRRHRGQNIFFFRFFQVFFKFTEELHTKSLSEFNNLKKFSIGSSNVLK